MPSASCVCAGKQARGKLVDRGRPDDARRPVFRVDLRYLIRTGSAAGYAAPDVLERLARLAMRDRDRDQLYLLPSCQEFAQVGLGEEVASPDRSIAVTE
jgi:hypothetical protein